LAVVYTRNDYGDGLEINPNTHPLMPSLSDLSPRDMQEGSTICGHHWPNSRHFRSILWRQRRRGRHRTIGPTPCPRW
jgi:hypothetical protein